MSLAIVRLALEEDIGTGDVTSRACVPASRQASGRFLARQSLIVAGLEVLEEIYPMAKSWRQFPAMRGNCSSANAWLLIFCSG